MIKVTAVLFLCMRGQALPSVVATLLMPKLVESYAQNTAPWADLVYCKVGK